MHAICMADSVIMTIKRARRSCCEAYWFDRLQRARSPCCRKTSLSHDGSSRPGVASKEGIELVTALVASTS